MLHNQGEMQIREGTTFKEFMEDINRVTTDATKVAIVIYKEGTFYSYQHGMNTADLVIASDLFRKLSKTWLVGE